VPRRVPNQAPAPREAEVHGWTFGPDQADHRWVFARFVDWGPTVIIWAIVIGLGVWAIRISLQDKRKQKAVKRAQAEHKDMLTHMWHQHDDPTQGNKT